MGKAPGDSTRAASRTSVERAVEAARAMRQSGMSDAELALTTALDRLLADAASRAEVRREQEAGPDGEKPSTPGVEYVKRERAPRGQRRR